VFTAGWPAAGSVHGTTPTLASTSNPTADCPSSSFSESLGVRHSNTEFEPHLAVDPRNEDHLVGVWGQDYWSWGMVNAATAGVSLDGGRTFTDVGMPFSCAPAGSQAASVNDVWDSIGPDGTVYASAIVEVPDVGIGVTASHDGGLTWGSTQVLHDPTEKCIDLGCTSAVASPYLDVDKPTITADPVHAGTAYVVWSAYRTVYLGNYPMMSKTTDFGVTWTQPLPIPVGQVTATTDGNLFLIDPRSGVLYDVFDQQNASDDPHVGIGDSSSTGTRWAIQVVSSSNGGLTWSPAHQVSPLLSVCEAGHQDRCSGVHSAGSEEEAAIDPKTGALYVVWQDGRFSNGAYDEIALSTSADGGITWSAPARVSTPSGSAAINPAVAVTSDGTVGVTYYDFRGPSGGPAGAGLPTTVWMSTSPAGGKAFGKDLSLTDAPFDFRLAPTRFGGNALGEYYGLVGGKDFHALFPTSATGGASGMSDIWSVTVPVRSGRAYPS
jgi:hypothetical protein